MKINPFWAAALVMLMVIALLNFDTLLKSAQDLDTSVQEHVRNSLNSPRTKKENVLHNAGLLESAPGVASQAAGWLELRAAVLLTGRPLATEARPLV